MRKLGVLLALLATGVAAADKGTNLEASRQAIRKLAGEKWVDGHMRRAVRLVDRGMSDAVEKLGGLKKAKVTTSQGLTEMTVATFPNGAQLVGHLIADRPGTVHRSVSVEGGTVGASLGATEKTLDNGGVVKNISAEVSLNGKKTSISRSYLPAREGVRGATITSTRERGTREKAGQGSWILPDLGEKDPARALAGHLNAVRAYDKLSTRSGRRAIRKLLREIDALVASGTGTVERHRVEEDMNMVSMSFPGGVKLTSHADELGAVSVELQQGGVEKKVFLNELAGRVSAIVTTTRPRAYKHGQGRVQDQLSIGSPFLDQEAPVQRSHSTTRPVKE